MWVGTKATSGELGNHATSHHISSFLPLLACQHCEPERTGRKYRLLRTPPWIGRQKLSPETCVWPVWPLVLFLREHRVHLATSTQALSEIQVLKQLWCSPPQEEMPFVAKEKLLVAIPCISYSLFWYVLICCIFWYFFGDLVYFSPHQDDKHHWPWRSSASPPGRQQPNFANQRQKCQRNCFWDDRHILHVGERIKKGQSQKAWLVCIISYWKNMVNQCESFSGLICSWFIIHVHVFAFQLCQKTPARRQKSGQLLMAWHCPSRVEVPVTVKVRGAGVKGPRGTMGHLGILVYGCLWLETQNLDVRWRQISCIEAFTDLGRFLMFFV